MKPNWYFRYLLQVPIRYYRKLLHDIHQATGKIVMNWPRLARILLNGLEGLERSSLLKYYVTY